ncbi:MAG: site-2 protease family protein [Kiritimatiellaeota bacterium]|nr:site-2 protease family protein [Kiritimatiellota bacterium]
MFIQQLFESPQYYLTWVVLVAFSICVHEFCHAWMAVHLGDRTPARYGRFTLNPLRVMGPMSLAMLFLFGIAWGAVPIDPRALRGRFGRFWVALVGPLSNLVLAAVFVPLLIVARRFSGSGASNPFLLLPLVGVRANCFLFVFNMLPVPILDGWTVYESLIPGMRRVSAQARGQVGIVVLLVLFMTPAGRFLWSVSEWLAFRLTQGGGVLFRLGGM